MTGKKYILKNDACKPFLYGDLKALSPHSLSFAQQESLYVPLALDFDCRLCKTNDQTHGRRQREEPQLLDKIKNFCLTIFNKLNNQRDADELQYFVFKAESKCNFHIYFNVNVSLCALTNLRVSIEDSFLC